MKKSSNPAEKIRQIISNIHPKIESISENDFALKPQQNKWSKKEILGHLIDSAYNNHQRILLADKKGELIFQGYDQNEWVDKNDYQNRGKNEILNLFMSVNFHLSHLIENLTNEALNHETTAHNFNQICMNPIEAGEPISLKYLIEDYIFHMNHHLSQIVG